MGFSTSAELSPGLGFLQALYYSMRMFLLSIREGAHKVVAAQKAQHQAAAQASAAAAAAGQSAGVQQLAQQVRRGAPWARGVSVSGVVLNLLTLI